MPQVSSSNIPAIYRHSDKRIFNNVATMLEGLAYNVMKSQTFSAVTDNTLDIGDESSTNSGVQFTNSISEYQ